MDTLSLILAALESASSWASKVCWI